MRRLHVLDGTYLLLITVSFAGWPLLLFVQAVMSNMLGASEFGVYAYVVAIASSVAIFARLGIDAAAPLIIPRLHAEKDICGQRAFLQGGAIRVFVAPFVIWCGLALVRFSGFELLGLSWLELGAAAFLTAAIAQFRLWQAFSHALLRHRLAQYFEKLVMPAGLLVSVGILLLADELSALSVLGAHVLIALLLVLILARSIFREYSAIASAKSSRWQSDWSRSGFNLVLLSGSQLLIQYTDIIVVGALNESAIAGFYAVAALLGQAPGIGMSIGNPMTGPRFTAAVKEMDHAVVRDLVRFWQSRVLPLAVTIVLILWLFGEQVLGYYGEGFAVANAPLRILSLAMLGSLALGPTGQLMVAAGMTKEAGRIAAGSAAANLLLNLVLVPEFGMVGAALSTLLATLTWNIAMRRKIRNRLGVESSFLVFFERRHDAA